MSRGGGPLLTGLDTIHYCTVPYSLTRIQLSSNNIEVCSGVGDCTFNHPRCQPLDPPVPTSHDFRALALELYDSSRTRLWGMFFVASSAHRDPDSSRRHGLLDGAYVFSLAGMTMMPSVLRKGGWLTRVIF